MAPVKRVSPMVDGVKTKKKPKMEPSKLRKTPSSTSTETAKPTIGTDEPMVLRKKRQIIALTNMSSKKVVEAERKIPTIKIDDVEWSSEIENITLTAPNATPGRWVKLNRKSKLNSANAEASFVAQAEIDRPIGHVMSIVPSKWKKTPSSPFHETSKLLPLRRKSLEGHDQSQKGHLKKINFSNKKQKSFGFGNANQTPTDEMNKNDDVLSTASDIANVSENTDVEENLQPFFVLVNTTAEINRVAAAPDIDDVIDCQNQSSHEMAGKANITEDEEEINFPSVSMLATPNAKSNKKAAAKTKQNANEMASNVYLTDDEDNHEGNLPLVNMSVTSIVRSNKKAATKTKQNATEMASNVYLTDDEDNQAENFPSANMMATTNLQSNKKTTFQTKENAVDIIGIDQQAIGNNEDEQKLSSASMLIAKNGQNKAEGPVKEKQNFNDSNSASYLTSDVEDQEEALPSISMLVTENKSNKKAATKTKQNSIEMDAVTNPTDRNNKEDENLPLISMLVPNNDQSNKIAAAEINQNATEIADITDLTDNDNDEVGYPLTVCGSDKTRSTLKRQARVSVIDLTDSPLLAINSADTLNSTFDASPNNNVETRRDATFSPVHSPNLLKEISPSLRTIPMTLQTLGSTKKSKLKSSPKLKRLQSSPMASTSYRDGTLFKRKPMQNNIVLKEKLTSAKKKKLCAIAKEATTKELATKRVAFNSPCEQLTPVAARNNTVVKIKKTPFKLDNSIGGNENKEPAKQTANKMVFPWTGIRVPTIQEIEAKEQSSKMKAKGSNSSIAWNFPGPTASISSKLPTKVAVPDFKAIHHRMFEGMESIDDAVQRTDRRAKMLLSGKKVVQGSPKIAKPIISGTRRALEPKGNQNLFMIEPRNRMGIADKLSVKSKTIDRAERRKQMYKQRPVLNRSNMVVKGVRSNRRFDLMMKFREEAQ